MPWLQGTSSFLSWRSRATVERSSASLARLLNSMGYHAMAVHYFTAPVGLKTAVRLKVKSHKGYILVASSGNVSLVWGSQAPCMSTSCSLSIPNVQGTLLPAWMVKVEIKECSWCNYLIENQALESMQPQRTSRPKLVHKTMLYETTRYAVATSRYMLDCQPCLFPTLMHAWCKHLLHLDPVSHGIQCIARYWSFHLLKAR